MSRLACPYCYKRIDGNRLWYQCTGRGAPGRTGCTPKPDDARRQWTGYQDPVRPSFPPSMRLPLGPAKADCPDCGGTSRVRVCPNCHTPLSSNFGATASPLIAMVGAKGTGKSVYLTVLAHELLNGLRRRFGADVRMTGAVKEPIRDYVGSVYADQALMAQTAAATNGRMPPTVFEWRQEQSRLGNLLTRYRTTFLSFYDTAGEDLNSDDRTRDLTYLNSADALILLLDPFMIPEARNQIRLPKEAVRSEQPTMQVLDRVTEKLRREQGVRSSGRIKIPVAVAFAKIDAFFDVLGPDHPLMRAPSAAGPYDETAGQATHEQVKALLHEWGADDIDTHLDYNYANYRYFPVSALGAPPDYSSGAVDRNGVHPFRVSEPLLWLLSKFDVIPRQRQP
ncbi:zinc ribbon domain-containing protein [Actinoplanes bogorensis]|uniref:Zinc ribbon domain-containing protein n=1 Tax=Paractinoplanes bogorensis TaxID=1610840 RepID=A0ABS5YXR4_9ACTN|nr:zinc ribbon domain-containing protein [Actinoplanes bogorensis]MBU2668233.1 zinc ribbon domain-containing protein [Actinoplanes bogorensis]